MLFSDLSLTARRALTANLTRSMLTMLGIIIGVSAVVLMTGIGKSMDGLILGQISTLGTSSMVIFPGSGPEGGEGMVKAGYDSITFGDIEALGKLESVTSLAPIILLLKKHLTTSANSYP